MHVTAGVPTKPTAHLTAVLHCVPLGQSPTYPTGAGVLAQDATQPLKLKLPPGVMHVTAAVPSKPTAHLTAVLHCVPLGQSPTYPTGAGVLAQEGAQPLKLKLPPGVMHVTAAVPTKPTAHLTAVLHCVPLGQSPTYPTGAGVLAQDGTQPR
eukprot:RCo045897